MSDTKTKVAIIGIGRWGKNLLKEFDEQTEVVWCVYKESEETKKFLTENYPHIKITTSFEDILKDPELEAVIVATPTHTHFEIGKKVLEANKHLFLEKPGCTNSAELEELVNEAEKRNLTFAIGYEFVHHPVLKKIKELIGNSKIHLIITEWFKWSTFADPALPHLLSHELSIIKTLGAKDIVSTHYQQEAVISDSDIIHADFITNIGKVMSVINRASPEKRKTVTIMTDKEKLVWNNNELFSIDESEKKLVPIPIDQTSAVACEIQDFLSAMRDIRKPLTNGRFALEIFTIIEKIT